MTPSFLNWTTGWRAILFAMDGKMQVEKQGFVGRKHIHFGGIKGEGSIAPERKLGWSSHLGITHPSASSVSPMLINCKHQTHSCLLACLSPSLQ